MSCPDRLAPSPVRAAAVADAMQAEYYRWFFRSQREALTTDLAKYVKRLTDYMTSGDMGEASRMRRIIRTTEGEMRAIDRLVEALDLRFPRSG